MAAVTAAMVKELREMTGAGMMDCKKALAATDGDMDKAVEFLREKGLAGAAKKAGRIAAEGMVVTTVSEDGKKAVVVEVNAETDFVAKNEKFRSYAADVAAQALNTSAKDMDSFMEEKWEKDPSLTVKEALSSQIAIIGENMNIRRFEQITEANGFVASYIHAGGKIGVLVTFDVEGIDPASEGFQAYGRDVAMQVAAASPVSANRESVPAEVVEHEMGIYKAQAAESGKPEAIQEKMATGRMEKFYKENCLTEQAFVKNPDQSINQYTDECAKNLGGTIKVTGFVRWALGETA